MLNLQEERIDLGLKDLGVGKAFMNKTYLAWEMLRRISNWNLFLLKSFCTAKYINKKIKDKLQSGKYS